MTERDLFGHAPQGGLLVKLDRGGDRDSPCCNNLATVSAASGPHAAALRCADCGQHRGWLPKPALDFITTTAARFGAPRDPIILRNGTFGDHIMEKKFDNTNRGVLFRDDKKTKETDRDYSGSIDIGGTEYWLSAWIKTSKAGKKFMSLSVKPKAEAAVASGKSRAEEMSDSISF